MPSLSTTADASPARVDDGDARTQNATNQRQRMGEAPGGSELGVVSGVCNGVSSCSGPPHRVECRHEQEEKGPRRSAEEPVEAAAGERPDASVSGSGRGGEAARPMRPARPSASARRAICRATEPSCRTPATSRECRRWTWPSASAVGCCASTGWRRWSRPMTADSSAAPSAGCSRASPPTSGASSRLGTWCGSGRPVRETGDRRQEQEAGDRRQETGDGRSETGRRRTAASLSPAPVPAPDARGRHRTSRAAARRADARQPPARARARRQRRSGRDRRFAGRAGPQAAPHRPLPRRSPSRAA